MYRVALSVRCTRLLKASGHTPLRVSVTAYTLNARQGGPNAEVSIDAYSAMSALKPTVLTLNYGADTGGEIQVARVWGLVRGGAISQCRDV